MPFINGGGSAYPAQVVGYFQGGQAASRAEVVFDATGEFAAHSIVERSNAFGAGILIG